MAYESVLWTAKTPITWDRLAQMQQNIDELRAILEGTQAYIEGTAKGTPKGLLHLQEITTTYPLPNAGTFVQIGSPFTPKTEAGRRYLMEIYLPRIHSYSGTALIRFFKDNVVFQNGIVNVGTDWRYALDIAEFPSNFSNFGYCGKHLVPGFSVTSVYKVDCLALFADSGQVFCNADNVGFIKFSDVGPAL